VYGLGGSWFRHAGGGNWTWQHNFFGFGHAADLDIRLLESGKVSSEFNAQMAKNAGAGRLPGWYPLSERLSPLWPPIGSAR
jgi:hypothetical protein